MSWLCEAWIEPLLVLGCLLVEDGVAVRCVRGSHWLDYLVLQLTL